MDESFTRVTVLEAGFPSIGVDPKSIYSFYTLIEGRMAVALIGTSIFLDPLTTITALVYILHGLFELTLNNI